MRRQAENAIDLVRIAEATHHGAERIPIGGSLLRRNGLQVGNGLQFLCEIENGGPALQMLGDDLYGVCGWHDCGFIFQVACGQLVGSILPTALLKIIYLHVKYVVGVAVVQKGFPLIYAVADAPARAGG